jgi:adenylate kinase family enzyme
MTRILCGFPGVGKSYLAKQANVLDTDSSAFAKDAQWPQNYVDVLIERASHGLHELILASTHKEVRDGLAKAGQRTILVYPDPLLKEEYLNRYRERGSPEPFIRLMELRWEEFLSDCRRQQNAWHWMLGPGQYLADCYPRIHQQLSRKSNAD